MTAAEAFESVFAFRNERYVKNRKFTVTASMFVWRSVFEAVGDFINSVPEDKDWCERARRQGYCIRFAPKSIVGHPARRTMGELKRKWRRLTLEILRRRPARGQGTGLRLFAPVRGSARRPAARVPAARLDTPGRDSKSLDGDCRVSTDSRLPLFGGLSSPHGAR